VSPLTEDARVSRLKRRREFLRVAEGGRKWVAPGMIVQARASRDGSQGKAGDEGGAAGFRVGFTVSRKVGSAVERNRARRRLRAAAAEILPGHARTGHDFVLIGRKATLKRPFRSLVGDLEKALRELDAYDE